MKKCLLFAGCLLVGITGHAQITIEGSDLPVAGDTLRFSVTDPVGVAVNLNNTGAAMTWDFSMLQPLSQGVDTYRTAANVSLMYAATFPQAYGHKVNNSFFPIPLPPNVQDPYFFYQKRTNPGRFVLRGYGVKLNGQPVAMSFSDEDEWYFLPLDYNDTDSSTFKLDFSILGNGIKQEGYRKTTVDGYGTIITPHFTSPVQCLRVRSFVDEVDTVTFGGPPIGIPRTYVDYKWLAKNEHFPVLWIRAEVVGGTENISLISFRDHYRPSLSVSTPQANIQELKAYPNPVSNDEVTIVVPMEWKHYQVSVFDLQGKLVTSQQDKSYLNMSALSAGQYLVRVTAGTETGYVRITRQ